MDLTLPLAQSVSSAVDAFSITNTGSGPAIRAESTGGFTGLYSTSSHNGVMGETSSNSDSGVVGVNHGNGWGIFGSSSLGIGVRGANTGGVAGIGVTGTSSTGSGMRH